MSKSGSDLFRPIQLPPELRIEFLQVAETGADEILHRALRIEIPEERTHFLPENGKFFRHANNHNYAEKRRKTGIS